jgi:hypothetical protein
MIGMRTIRQWYGSSEDGHLKNMSENAGKTALFYLPVSYPFALR